MSTSYRLLCEEKPTKDSFLKQLAKSGISLQEDGKNDSFCIGDGKNFLWCFLHQGVVSNFERYGGNEVEEILEAIRDSYGVVLSEYDPGFSSGYMEED